MSNKEKKKIIPNEWDCEGCEHWDSVNGCWRDYKEFCGYNVFEPQGEEDSDDCNGDCESCKYWRDEACWY